MSIFTNQNKSSAPSWSQPNESSITWNPHVKAGQGWLYDQANITYDGPTDPVSGNEIFYDGVGVAPSWTNQNKS